MVAYDFSSSSVDAFAVSIAAFFAASAYPFAVAFAADFAAFAYPFAAESAAFSFCSTFAPVAYVEDTVDENPSIWALIAAFIAVVVL